MRRFFIPSEQIQDNEAEIRGTDVHHIRDVLRLQAGDTFPATDGQGNLLTVRIRKIEDDIIVTGIVESTRAGENKVKIRLYQAIPRGNKFDWIIEKACELGVVEVIPVISERTISRLSEERGLKKIGRWERIAGETAKQVGRVTSMSIHNAISFKDIQKSLLGFSLKLVPWEMEETKSLKLVLQENVSLVDIEVIIGPEGGFSAQEIDSLRENGFQSVTLGGQILKSETAAIVTIGNILFSRE